MRRQKTVRVNRQKMLGLERLERLNKRTARERVKTLEINLENGKYDGNLAVIAKQWASWYRSYANKKIAL